jgi:hypothetical protein
MMIPSRWVFPLFFLILELVFSPSLFALRTVHVFVALCDNEHQGIVPVAPIFGNGDDPENNLYWGASYGVRSYFSRSKEWEMVSKKSNLSDEVLERCIFRHRDGEVFIAADAYRGKDIESAIMDFLNAASGNRSEQRLFIVGTDTFALSLFGEADLLAYVGHDGLMDFSIESYPTQKDSVVRNAIIIACISKVFFEDAIRTAGANPLVWTAGLLAAEAYPLKAAIDGWILSEDAEEIRIRAAGAYHKYQKCGLKAAMNLFVTGF